MDWLLRAQEAEHSKGALGRWEQNTNCLHFPLGFSKFQRGLEAKEKVNEDVKYIAAFVYLGKIIILQWHPKNRSKVLWMSGSAGRII